jgi:hypothetical protein
MLISDKEKGVAVLAVPPADHERRRPEQIFGLPGRGAGRNRRRGKDVVGRLQEILGVLGDGLVGEEETFRGRSHRGSGARGEHPPVRAAGRRRRVLLEVLQAPDRLQLEAQSGVNTKAKLCNRRDVMREETQLLKKGTNGTASPRNDSVCGARGRKKGRTEDG